MQFLNNFLADQLTPAAHTALSQAICSRGRRQGLVKKSTPPMNTPGYVGWQAIMAELAPTRVSIGGLMFLYEYERKVFWECEKYCRALHTYINENLQRPFEFNMYEIDGRG